MDEIGRTVQYQIVADGRSNAAIPFRFRPTLGSTRSLRWGIVWWEQMLVLHNCPLFYLSNQYLQSDRFKINMSHVGRTVKDLALSVGHLSFES